MVLQCLPSTHDKDDTGWLGWVIAMVILTFTGIIINLFCLTVLLQIKSVNLNPNKFLVVLFSSQLILCVIVAPFRIKILISTSGIENCTLGKISDYLYSLIIASQVSHVTISYDRWLHVLLSFNYKHKMRGRLLHILLALPWVITVGYIIALSIGVYTQYGYLVILAFTLITSLAANYYRLVKKLDEQDKNLELPESSRVERRKRHYKVTSLCFYVVLLQLICSIPSLMRLYSDVHGLIHLEIEKEIWKFLKTNNANLEDICFIALLLGASINPAIYLFRHHEFKNYLTNLWCSGVQGVQAKYDFTATKDVQSKTKENFSQHAKLTQLVFQDLSPNGSILLESIRVRGTVSFDSPLSYRSTPGPGEICSVSLDNNSMQPSFVKPSFVVSSWFRRIKSDIALNVHTLEETEDIEETEFDTEVDIIEETAI